MNENDGFDMRVWLRNLVIGAVALFLTFKYVSYAILEKSYTSYGAGPVISEIVIVWSVFFLVLMALTSGLPRLLRITRGDMLYFFIFMFLASPMMLTTMYFFKQVTYAYYNARTSEAAKALVEQHLTRRAPDDAAINTMYQGAPDHRIDWGAWLTSPDGGIPPLVAWGVFALLFLAICFAFVFIFSRRWLEDEQLAFPVQKMGELFIEGQRAPGGMGDERLPLFGAKAFWIGFALTLGFQACTYFSPGLEYRVGSFSIKETVPLIGQLDYPARQFWWRPVYLALFFLCPQRILGSMIVFHVLECLFSIVGFQLGYHNYTGSEVRTASAFPFKQDQLLGGSIALAAIMLALSWKYLREQFRVSVRWPWMSESERRASGGYPLRIPALFLSVAGFAVWGLVLGLPLPAVMLFLAGIFLAVIVNARGRAETGMPNTIVFDNYRPFMFIPVIGTKVVGTAGIAAGAVYGWLFSSTLLHATPSLMDSMKMGQSMRRTYLWVFSVAGAALVAGLLIGGWVTMSGAYDLGIRNWEYRWGSGDYEAWQAAELMKKETGFNGVHAAYTVGGGVVVSVLWFLRSIFPWFGLHPMGYLLSLHPGLHHFQLALYLAFIVKALSLHYGGLRTYTRLVPFFLGLAFGQIFGGALAGVLNIIFGTSVYVPML